MTPISSTNSAIALSILQRMNTSSGSESEATGSALISAFGPLEPIGRASRQAAAAIIAIVNDGGTIDLSSFGGNAVVYASDHATIVTGDGDDFVSAQGYAIIRTGKGNDSVSSYDYATIDAGDGDDSVGAYSYATVNAGSGNDLVDVYDHSTVDAGDGDDWVHANGYAVVNGGRGNDVIRTYDYSKVDAGEGDDFVVTLGYSTINGGVGNDTLVVSNRRSELDSTFDYANIDGGDGDDYIQVNANSTVTGGTGNDTIRLIGDGNTVHFNKGDGRDIIGIGVSGKAAIATIKITGYTADDVAVTQGDAGIMLTFKGSDDSLNLKFAQGSTAKLEFDDGSSFNLQSAHSASLTRLDVSADARLGEYGFIAIRTDV
jgi:Ca2+-binding RTX toxin-like protein